MALVDDVGAAHASIAKQFAGFGSRRSNRRNNRWRRKCAKGYFNETRGYGSHRPDGKSSQYR